MILNAYAVLDGFTSLVRLLLGVLIVGQGIAAWHRARSPALAPEDRTAQEDRFYLLFLLAITLLVLNLASWPFFYLLLQSYVPVWREAGVMCIYGVTRIGTGSQGPSRFLPGLIDALQISKPALVFLSGAWFVLYLVNRRTSTSPLQHRTLLLLIVVGALAVGDAATEIAYLAIPKKEEIPSTGCCSEAFDGASRTARFLPQALLGERFYPWLYAAYYVSNVGMVVALAAATRRPPTVNAIHWLAPLLVGTLVAFTVSAVFLVEIAAPALLRTPYHHCPYDLLPDVPESMAGIGLFLAGCFSVGWACVLGWFGNCMETRPFLRGAVATLLRLGLLGYLGSVMMISLELALV